VFMNNYVHDNNDPNVPGAGVAAAGPVGTGMSISGGRDNTVMNNRFENNAAWAIILVPYPDTETPPPGQDCQGGTAAPGDVCMYDDWGNELENNTFKNNGGYGNDTNGDIAELTQSDAPTNCFHGNTEAGGGDVKTSPSGLQQSKPTCGSNAAPDPNPSFLNQVVCDSQFFASLSPAGGGTPCIGASYPTKTKTVMHPLPAKQLATMPNPCKGVPANRWCPRRTRRR
jgi:hypothetical protein